MNPAVIRVTYLRTAKKVSYGDGMNKSTSLEDGFTRVHIEREIREVRFNFT